MPSLPSSIYAKLDAALDVPISPELRRAGDPTPAVVYELAQVSDVLAMDGTSTGFAVVQARFDCVADGFAAANALAASVVTALDGKWTQGGIAFVATATETSTARAVPDDGQEDAERIATVVMTFATQEV